ncbi:MAG TPA: hypothetical protein VKG44_09435 [Candidatus Baltobacteraceae bacterium]|nr:hypothetical protein [Candidatus Baltobacteraceae bacterium]
MAAAGPAQLAFSVGVLALIVGGIRLWRARFERKRPDPFAFVLLGVGVASWLIALLLYNSIPTRL